MNGFHKSRTFYHKSPSQPFGTIPAIQCDGDYLA